MQTDRTHLYYTIYNFLSQHFENFHPDFSLRKLILAIFSIILHLFGTTFIYFSPMLSEHEENSSFYNVSKYHSHCTLHSKVIQRALI